MTLEEINRYMAILNGADSEMQDLAMEVIPKEALAEPTSGYYRRDKRIGNREYRILLARSYLCGLSYNLGYEEGQKLLKEQHDKRI